MIKDKKTKLKNIFKIDPASCTLHPAPCNLHPETYNKE